MTAGIDTPDGRGRTGLDRTGLDLTGNPRVKVREVKLLSSHWYVERATTFDFRHADGTWSTQQRETHDRGNGATMLLYDTERETVLLTRQFRFPVYVNGHPDGMLVETPGGLLDDDDEHLPAHALVIADAGLRPTNRPPHASWVQAHRVMGSCGPNTGSSFARLVPCSASRRCP